MEETGDFETPAGFEPLDTHSPFNRHLGPYFAKHVDARLTLGLRVAEHHCNSGGRLHGGTVCALADIALGHNIGLALAEKAGTLQPGAPIRGSARAPIATASLTTDFVGSARRGDWITCEVDVQRVGGTLAFANAYVLRDDERIARASAVFRVLEHRD